MSPTCLHMSPLRSGAHLHVLASFRVHVASTTQPCLTPPFFLFRPETYSFYSTSICVWRVSLWWGKPLFIACYGILSGCYVVLFGFCGFYSAAKVACGHSKGFRLLGGIVLFQGCIPSIVVRNWRDLFSISLVRSTLFNTALDTMVGSLQQAFGAWRRHSLVGFFILLAIPATMFVNASICSVFRSFVFCWLLFGFCFFRECIVFLLVIFGIFFLLWMYGFFVASIGGFCGLGWKEKIGVFALVKGF